MNIFRNILFISFYRWFHKRNNDSIRILIKTALTTENPAVRTALLKGMLKGLEGQNDVDPPEGWCSQVLNLKKEIPEHQSLARQIAKCLVMPMHRLKH